MMQFYSFQEIRAAADCRQIAIELFGCKIEDGRCAALWRGGDNPQSVSIKHDEWYDHRAKTGGGCIELAAFKFNGNIQEAQAWLGERYKLEPRKKLQRAPSTHESRFDKLTTEGYQPVAKYEYANAAGAVVHVVIRLEHPDGQRKKEFVQGVPDAKSRDGIKWGLDDIETVLYRLDVVSGSSWVALVEGEKSCDRMNSIGIPSTTACGGAKKWHNGLTESLRGKHVAIFPDNDEPGREHAQIVAQAIAGVAASVRIVPNHSTRQKGGIDDWLDEDGGHTADDVLQLIDEAPEYVPPTDLASLESASHGPTEAMLLQAKQANTVPFRNYIPVEVQVQKRGKPTNEVTKEPRAHQDMLDDLSRRFLGFPRRVGRRQLFDHDRDSGKIVEIDYPVQLKAWIGRRSKRPAEFTRGDGFVGVDEFYESVVVTAQEYQSVSLVPDWPRRAEVYYAHDAIPNPSPTHEYLQDFVDMFLPATPIDRCLIMAFVCCPLWFIPGVPRPSWIIDSKDGQGSGKTKMVELISELYGAAPITVSKNDIERDQKEVRKRCVSRSGRNARVFLVDNVTGNFKSPDLAALISYKNISGMAPYGHGEESRPNNLVYVITSNSATVDSDLADRSLYIHVRKPQDRLGWVQRVQTFIEEHRLEIVADIIDLLKTHKQFAPPSYRFSEFDACILQPCCGCLDMYRQVIEQMSTARAESNVEEELARSIIDQFTHRLTRMGLFGQPVFLQNRVVNSWTREAVQDIYEFKQSEYPIQLVRNLAKTRLIPQINSDIRRWPQSRCHERYSGLAWGFKDQCSSATVVFRDGDGAEQFKEVTVDHSTF